MLQLLSHWVLQIIYPQVCCGVLLADKDDLILKIYSALLIVKYNFLAAALA